MELAVGLALGLSFLTAMSIRELRNLQEGMSFLPQSKGKSLFVNHPIVGRNIHDLIQLPAAAHGRELVLLAVSTECAACHSSLEEFLYLHRQWEELPLVCLVASAEPGALQEFLDTYSGMFPLLIADQELMQRLQITYSPMFTLIGPDGLIRNVSPNLIQLERR